MSDTRSAETDLSGPAAVKALRAQGFEEFEVRLVRDEIDEIRAAIIDLSEMCHAVFTTGGTGFSPRDVTPEATAPLLDRRADNLSEHMRMKGLAYTPLSYLSRGICGMRGRCLIVNLPGSPKGAQQGIIVLGPLLGPILDAQEPPEE